MDGIALELWNKKLLLCRHKRQAEFKSCLDLALGRGTYSTTDHFYPDLFEVAADNLDVLIMHWKETFQGSWRRQNSADPVRTAQHAEGEVQSILSNEVKQIESEIQSLITGRGLPWKPEEMVEGKAYLDRKIQVLSASCREQIVTLKSDREDELKREKFQQKTRRIEVLQTRIVGVVLVLVCALGGVWLGAYLNAKHSKEDRMYIDERINLLFGSLRQTQDELSELRRSNRKIAFWTEKTPAQIDAEMQEARDTLNAEVQDIRDQTAKKIALLESDYARDGKQPDMEFAMSKKALLNYQDKQIAEVEDKTRKTIEELEEQKENLMK